MAATSERVEHEMLDRAVTASELLREGIQQASRAAPPFAGRRLLVSGEVRDCKAADHVYFLQLANQLCEHHLAARLKLAEPKPSIGDYVTVEGRLEIRWNAQTGDAKLELAIDRLARNWGTSNRRKEHLGRLAELSAKYGARRPLPSSLSRVALVTAAGSDAAEDFYDRASSRVEITPFFAAMNDVDALCQAIDEAARSQPDLVVITRGGGALIELDRFSTLDLVERVARLSEAVPTLVAIGHSKDHPDVERVASKHVGTPSAAGALCFRLARPLPKRAAPTSRPRPAPAPPVVVDPRTLEAVTVAVAPKRRAERIWRGLTPLVALLLGCWLGWVARGWLVAAEAKLTAQRPPAPSLDRPATPPAPPPARATPATRHRQRATGMSN